MNRFRRVISVFITLCLMISYLSITSCKEKTSSMYEDNMSIPETDMAGIEYYQTPSENIVTDKETGIMFVNNELLVYGMPESLESEIYRTVQKFSGKIVGKIPVIKEYQVQFSFVSSYSELEAMAQTLEREDCIEKVFTNIAMPVSENSYYPNDSNWQSDWGDMPIGSNWGVEAIDAPGAWEYRDKMQTVNIGIIDNMFYTSHEDLTFAEKPLGNATAIAKYKGEFNSHGTHVAGTMAADFDNDKGISGIAVKKNLYGVANWGMGGYSPNNANTSTQVWHVSFAYLIAMKKCRVINISLGVDQIAFAASRGNDNARRFLSAFNNNISYFLKKLIDANYDFVICKSSGNQNRSDIEKQKKENPKYLYFKADSNDNYTYGYYSYSDYLKWKNGKVSDYSYDTYDNRVGSNKKNGIPLEAGNVDAEYDILSGITDKTVADHIIVVGAIKNNGTKKVGGFLFFGSHDEHQGFSISNYSQCGERVDVVAPGGEQNGINIYSTISNDEANRSEYSDKFGTSMASPHVAGVAALVYSVNPKLSGKQVKSIICSTTTGSYDGYCNDQRYSYGMVNAKAAVEKALDEHPDGSFDPFIYDGDAVVSNDVSSDDISSEPISSDNFDDATVSSKEYDDHEIEYITQYKIASRRDYTGDWSYIYEYDSNGNLIKLRNHNGIRNIDEVWWTYYYENGVCVYKKEYSFNGEVSKTEYTYDRRGRLIREYVLSYVNSGYLDESNTEYTYDSFDRVLTKLNYDYNSEDPIYTTEYEYDSAGFCTKEVYYKQTRDDTNFEGMTGWKEYTYNDDHTSATSYTFSSDGTRSGNYTLYTYDENGNCLTEEHYDENGEINWWTSWKYTYKSFRVPIET